MGGDPTHDPLARKGPTARRHPRREGHQLLGVLLERRGDVACACSTTGAPRSASRLTEVDAHCWHAYLPEVGAGARYGYRAQGEWAPERGLWHNDSKLLLDPYARVIEGEVRWDPACFAYSFEDPDRPETTDSAPFVPRSVVESPWFDWGHDRPPDTPMHETVIYELHVKGFTALHPTLDPHLRGTYAGLAHPEVIAHLQRTRGHRGRAAARALLRARPPAGGARTAQLLGLQQHRVLRPPCRLRSRPRPRSRVQAHGPVAARGGHRGDPRRRLQPHRRGQPPGSDAVHARARQRRVLPARGGRPLLPGLHRYRQHARHAPTPHAAAGHGQPAVLGDRDARRRVPFRPGLGAGPRAARRGPSGPLLRPDPTGPGHQRHQVDRRAVGHRRGRLPGRQLPADVVGVERPLPRHGPRLLARGSSDHRRVRLPLHR